MTSALRRRDETGSRTDVIEEFYDRHPYPPPVHGSRRRGAARDALAQRRAPTTSSGRTGPYVERDRSLVAGCGTTQAARHAMLRGQAEVVGIDVSSASLEHSRRSPRRHGVDNLDAPPARHRGRRRARPDVRPHRLHRRAAPPRRPGRRPARAREVLAPRWSDHADGVRAVRASRGLPAPGLLPTARASARRRTTSPTWSRRCARSPLGHPISRLLRESPGLRGTTTRSPTPAQPARPCVRRSRAARAPRRSRAEAGPLGAAGAVPAGLRVDERDAARRSASPRCRPRNSSPPSSCSAGPSPGTP